MSRLLLLLATLRAHAVSLQGTSRRSGFMSTATLARGVDYFNPTFVAPQLTPKQFLIISSPSEQKIVYTELKNFKATTGRTFALIDSGLSEPQGLALDHDRGALYVADKGAKKILRFHVYVEDNGNGRQLVTDGVQLCVMQNADSSWVNVDINGDVFYSDATTKTINRIPVEVIDMLSKGSYSASDLSLVSEKTLEHGGGATSNVAVSRFVYSLYEGSANPHVSTPAGLVSDGARLYWTNSVSGKSVGSVVEGEVSPKLASGATSFPSTMLSNQSDTGYGMTKSSKYIFLSALNNGMGVVSGVTTGGATFDFITGLSSPRGLCWDGDQTIYVADEAAGVVYSFPGGRLMTGAPFTKSAVLRGAFGVAVLSEQDKAWPLRPFRA